ncbi:hypothetical protein ACO11K_002240 [Bacillus cytotoxicus]
MGMTTVEIFKVRHDLMMVKGLEANDETIILDIKNMHSYF